MELPELFSKLAYGELANHHMASAGDGTLAVIKQPQVVHFCNEALLRLYTKYILKEKDCILQLNEDISLYHLKPEYSLVGYNPLLASNPYILDNVDAPFLDDVLKVLGAYSSLHGKRPLNDSSSCWSVNTPTNKQVQVTGVCTDEQLAITYQASHPKIVNTEEGNKSIELPETLWGALTAYIAFGVYFNMNTPESHAIAQGHLAMFNNICNDVMEADALNLSISDTSVRFDSRGWV
jgi:hypothetical protein